MKRLPTLENTLDLPVRRKTRNVFAEVDLMLWKTAQKEIEKSGFKIVDVVEWGFKAFLQKKNPRALKALTQRT